MCAVQCRGLQWVVQIALHTENRMPDNNIEELVPRFTRFPQPLRAHAASPATSALAPEVIAAFCARVNPRTFTPDPTACVLWACKPDKYGRLRVADTFYSAHRVSYQLLLQSHGRSGDIPDKLPILHSCDHPGCVNWWHLRVGTHKENSDEARRKGRLKSSGNAEAQLAMFAERLVPLLEKRLTPQRRRSISPYGYFEAETFTRARWREEVKADPVTPDSWCQLEIVFQKVCQQAKTDPHLLRARMRLIPGGVA